MKGKIKEAFAVAVVTKAARYFDYIFNQFQLSN